MTSTDGSSANFLATSKSPSVQACHRISSFDLDMASEINRTTKTNRAATGRRGKKEEKEGEEKEKEEEKKE